MKVKCVLVQWFVHLVRCRVCLIECRLCLWTSVLSLFWNKSLFGLMLCFFVQQSQQPKLQHVVNLHGVILATARFVRDCGWCRSHLLRMLKYYGSWRLKLWRVCLQSGTCQKRRCWSTSGECADTPKAAWTLWCNIKWSSYLAVPPTLTHSQATVALYKKFLSISLSLLVRGSQTWSLFRKLLTPMWSRNFVILVSVIPSTN